MRRSFELFTGAGGLALGIHNAGFHHIGVIEHNHDACDTLRLNRKRQATTNINWPVHEKDVSKFDYQSYKEDQIDLLAGGAPCQPFSLGGKHAGHADARNMFPEVFRAVRALKPKVILLENVRGLLRKNFFPYFEYIIDQLCMPFIELYKEENWQDHALRLKQNKQYCLYRNSDTYNVKWRLYNTADFGIPQERYRVFIVATRSDIPINWQFPDPTHSQDSLLYSQYVSGDYWKENNLSPVTMPSRSISRVNKLRSKGIPLHLPWRTVRDVIKDLPEPIDYDPNPPFDNHVGIPDARIYPGHTGSPWDWPAKTIKAGDHGNPGGENMLRRDDGSVRYFTVRELARLQTFPDYWHFANSWTESRRQLGNAVPVKMAEILAQLIAEDLDRVQHQLPVEYREVARRVLLNVDELSR